MLEFLLQLSLKQMSVDRTKACRPDLRILKKSMIYCSGLPSILTESELHSNLYFGQYGQIEKLVITPYPNRNYCSVYITYAHEFEAALAILACNQFQVERSTLWCLFGTMKYCRFFLRKVQCKNLPNCPYLHVLDEKNQIEIKNSPSEAYPLHQKLAREVAKKYPERARKIMEMKKMKTKLPSPQLIYIEKERDRSIGKKEAVLNGIQQNKFEKDYNNSGNSNANSIGNINFNLEQCVKAMLLNQLKKSKGSRVFENKSPQEKHLKEIIISKLKE